MNKHNKKQKILNKAIDLFAENGISKVSLKQIAKEIDASRGMIYYYFKNGKREILSEILKIFEDCVSDNIPDKKEWGLKDADARDVLNKLFFRFPKSDVLRLRKIVKIMIAEMYYDKQIASHVKNYMISGREALLADCFQALVKNGKIAPLDEESAARFFNRLLFVYAIEDALLYPFEGNEEIAELQQKRAIHDCLNFVNYVLSAR